MSLHLLFEIDLSVADIEVFDRYEDLALAVLAEHGGVLEMRVRDLDERREWHLLRLPDHASWQAFRDDPRRVGQSWLLERARVRVLRYEVEPVR
jgi:hypothetical protein